MTGSEGLLGVVTEVTVRILQKPETARAVLIGFPTVEQGGDCVASIIAAGIIPGGLEMMDRPAINAAEDFCNAGYPRDVAVAADLRARRPGGRGRPPDRHRRARSPAQHGGTYSKVSESEAERLRSGPAARTPSPPPAGSRPTICAWTAPSRAASSAYVLERMQEMSARHGLRVANVFHAGDGNLHPLILYDANIPGELEAAEEFGADILRLCVEVGGVLTGEHGVGVEKRDLMETMFNEDDLKQQQRLKCAFDPAQILNPGKVFPMLHRCAELGRVHVHKGEHRFPGAAAVLGATECSRQRRSMRPVTVDEALDGIGVGPVPLSAARHLRPGLGGRCHAGAGDRLRRALARRHASA